MVAHGLWAQMQLLSDLPCRTAEFEHPQHLGLARRQARKLWQRRGLALARDLAEHANHPVPAKKRHRTHLDRQAIAVPIDHDELGVGDGLAADHLAGEQVERALLVLGRHDR